MPIESFPQVQAAQVVVFSVPVVQDPSLQVSDIPWYSTLHSKVIEKDEFQC